MTNESTDPTHVAIASASAGLTSVPSSPFTDNAVQRLQETVNEFIADLVDEAFRTARRHRSEVVSARYVESAATYLVAGKTRRLFRHLGTIGGALVGGSLSNILAMVQTGQPLPITGSLVSLAIGFVGTFLLALHIARD